MAIVCKCNNIRNEIEPFDFVCVSCEYSFLNQIVKPIELFKYPLGGDNFNYIKLGNITEDSVVIMSFQCSDKKGSCCLHELFVKDEEVTTRAKNDELDVCEAVDLVRKSCDELKSWSAIHPCCISKERCERIVQIVHDWIEKNRDYVIL